MSLKPKTYPILVEAIENGVRYGYHRSYKHTDNPDPDQVKANIISSVINEIFEWFDIEETSTSDKWDD